VRLSGGPQEDPTTRALLIETIEDMMPPLSALPEACLAKSDGNFHIFCASTPHRRDLTRGGWGEEKGRGAAGAFSLSLSCDPKAQ
jgi:hypothetical protein